MGGRRGWVTEEQQESQPAKFSDLKRNEKPRRAPGDGGTSGLPSSGWPRNKTLTLRTILAMVCFGYDLGCDREADAG